MIGIRKYKRRGLAAAAVMLAAAALLAGCASRPQRAATDVALPAEFGGGGGEQLPDRWWEALGDSGLDALIEHALAGSPSLQATRDRLDQAEALARKSGASRWPTLDAEVGGSRTVVGTSTPAGDVTDWSTNLSLGLRAGYELDLWGRVGATAEAAELDAVASAEDLRTARITLAATVAETWYSLVAARRRRELTAAQLETNERTLELVGARFRTGQVGAADVLQQRQQVEAKTGDLALATARAEVLANELAVLMGEIPGTKAVPAAGDLIDLPPLPETGLPADMVRRRPDVRADFARLLAADARAAAAAADRFPRISLSASGSTDAEDVEGFFDDWLVNLAANLTMPLIDGGGRAAEADRTRAAAQEKLHLYGQTVLSAVSEVENALVNEEGQRAYLASLEKQAALSAQTVERIRQSYLNGAETYLRVLDAVLTDQALGLSRIEARRQLISYRIQLCRSLAGGWDQDTNTGTAAAPGQEG